VGSEARAAQLVEWAKHLGQVAWPKEPGACEQGTLVELGHLTTFARVDTAQLAHRIGKHAWVQLAAVRRSGPLGARAENRRGDLFDTREGGRADWQ